MTAWRRRGAGGGAAGGLLGMAATLAVVLVLCLVAPRSSARAVAPSSLGASSPVLTTTTSSSSSSRRRGQGDHDAATAVFSSSAWGAVPSSDVHALVLARGGASESFLGRVLRAWRGSATPVGKRGGLLSRLRRFVKALVSGKSSSSSSGGGIKTTVKGGSKIKAAAGGSSKARGRIDKHLGKEYRRGNANFRIQKELREWLANPMENLDVAVGDNIRVWVVTLTGAKGTIFAGEKYKLKFTFPMDYPSKPPSVYFLQPTPRHEHVYTNGDICLNLLGRDWRPNMSAASLALSILSMLSSAKEKKIPQDNHVHADNPPGKAQAGWLYHDDKC